VFFSYVNIYQIAAPSCVIHHYYSKLRWIVIVQTTFYDTYSFYSFTFTFLIRDVWGFGISCFHVISVPEQVTIFTVKLH